MHTHVYGRATTATIQKYGDAVQLPNRNTGFYNDFKPLDADDVAEIKADIIKLLASDKTGTVTARDLGNRINKRVTIVGYVVTTKNTSTRKIRYNGGDPYDIKYENDTIDVKATHGVIDKWFYNKEFFIDVKVNDNVMSLPKNTSITDNKLTINNGFKGYIKDIKFYIKQINQGITTFRNKCNTCRKDNFLFEIKKIN
jgi:hypothetical protein